MLAETQIPSFTFFTLRTRFHFLSKNRKANANSTQLAVTDLLTLSDNG